MQNLLSKLLRLKRVRHVDCYITDMFQNLAELDSGDPPRMDKKKVVFVLGPPGVGKGTQCAKIAEKYDFLHISAGDLLRKERQMSNSQHGATIDSCMREGKIVPFEITCKLLANSIFSSKKNYFLIDGFPRNEDNREGWNRTIGVDVEVLFILFLECPVDICMERCLKRGSGSSSDRFDDTKDILRKRIMSFLEETRPMLEYYVGKDLVRFVDGNRTETEVFGDIEKIIDSYNIFQKKKKKSAKTI